MNKKILPAAQRYGQGLGCNVVLLLVVVLWECLAFGLEDFQLVHNFQNSLAPLSFFGISQPPKKLRDLTIETGDFK